MSIISAVYVPEGIAMAADSRVTGNRVMGQTIEQFTISENGQKLFLLESLKIGIASCGDLLIGGKTIADFLRMFEITKLNNNEDNIHTASAKLQEQLSQTSASPQTTFILGGYVGDDAFVYVVTKQSSTCARSEVAYGANWGGQLEAIQRLILGNAQETPIEWNLMPLKDGVDFAEFIVELTIKYQRFAAGIATCGGPIDVLVLTKDYAKFIKHKIFNP